MIVLGNGILPNLSLKCHEQFEIVSMGTVPTNFGLIDVGEWFLYCYTVYEHLNIRLVLTFVVSCHLMTCHWCPHHIHYWKCTRFGWFGGDIIWETPFRASLWRSRCLEGHVSLQIPQLQIRYWSPCLALGGGSKPAGKWRTLWAGSKNDRCFAWTDLIIYHDLSSFIYRGCPLRIISNPVAYLKMTIMLNTTVKEDASHPKECYDYFEKTAQFRSE